MPHPALDSSLTATADVDRVFALTLPKLEAHAHLNGSIPDYAIAELIRRKAASGTVAPDDELLSFRVPDQLADVMEFFPIFGRAIYRLTDSVEAIEYATTAVLREFADENCALLELRTTPRAVSGLNGDGMTRLQYVEAVTRAIDRFESEPTSGHRMIVRLILSVDRRHTIPEADEVVDLAILFSNRKSSASNHVSAATLQLARRGYVVGVDLCGSPVAGDETSFAPAFRRAKEAGLGITVHFGEIPANLRRLPDLLAYGPSRLGHATHLTPAVQNTIVASTHSTEPLTIEICLSSNVQGKTVQSLDEHHLKWALDKGVRVLICTDDRLIFRASLTDEHVLALDILRKHLARKTALAERTASAPVTDGSVEARRALVELVRQGIGALFVDKGSKHALRARIDDWAVGDGAQYLR